MVMQCAVGHSQRFLAKDEMRCAEGTVGVLQGLYSWWQYCLCDVFIELVKPVVQADDSEPGAGDLKQAYRDTLWLCLDIGLRYLCCAWKLTPN